MGIWRRAAGLVALLMVAASATPASAEDRFKAYTVDVGTGLAMYFELPGGPGGRPWRILYDTGKGQSEGVDNDLASFLVSDKVGLRPTDGADFHGDVIDFFVLSHPHEDHFNGAKPIFDLFDVRNVLESKQLGAVRYLKRFKAAAIAEILRARERGVEDAHYYVVGLPYPNGFDQPREGKPYDEYEIANKYLPDFARGVIDARKFLGKVQFPFGPEQVAQRVDWPVRILMGESEKGMKYLEDPADADRTLGVDVLPVGTHFSLGRHGGFTVMHGDTIAALDYKVHSSGPYKEAWPYYSQADLNDASLTIRVQYKKASILVPGDTEGRSKKPSTMVSMTEIFGSGEGQDAYTKADLEKYLRRDKPKAEQLPLLPDFEKYVMDSHELLRLAYYSYVTLDQLSPGAFDVKSGDHEISIPAHDFASPADIPEDVVFWKDRSDLLRDFLHPKWKSRLFKLYQDLKINRQKFAALRNRFKGWNRGNKPRMRYQQDRFRLAWDRPVWSVTNLVQLTERLYYVDPGLANIFAGFLIRSDLFLDYVAPKAAEDRQLRGEKHMMDVATQIQQESGIDVLASDVLVLGHHGSFTSTSSGFMKRVNPAVGIISADDKNYSGSTLPDFSALFWNMNSKHPDARAQLHSMFFHADMLALKRGEPVDGYAWRNRYSQSAARVFRRRRGWPVPLWRTDFNDDLENVNVLMDNILIDTDGNEPIWKWARHRKGESNDLPPDAAEHPNKYRYWAQELISAHPPGSPVIVPEDPTGTISTFSVGGRLEHPRFADPRMLEAFTGSDDEDDFDEEDWTHHH